jgi:hypothetical protein
MKWIGPSVRVLYKISSTLGEGIGMVRTINPSWPEVRCNIVVQAHPAKAVFSGLSVLLAVRSSVFIFVDPFNADILQAAKDVRASHDALVDLFEHIQFYLKRLGVHTQISPTKDMVEILVKIMVEVLSILSIATREMQQCRTSQLFLQDKLNYDLTALIFNQKYISKN